jgi:hypothetical protein
MLCPNKNKPVNHNQTAVTPKANNNTGARYHIYTTPKEHQTKKHNYLPRN